MGWFEKPYSVRAKSSWLFNSIDTITALNQSLRRRREMGPEFYGEPGNPSAIVIRQNFSVAGIEFFSPSSFSQQLGLMTRPAGYQVAPHIHNVVERKISITQEVLFIRSGTCKINLFRVDKSIEYSIDLHKGDVVLLAQGGHEVVMLTECDILEVKQGPYAGDNDKTPLFG